MCQDLCTGIFNNKIITAANDPHFFFRLVHSTGWPKDPRAVRTQRSFLLLLYLSLLVHLSTPLARFSLH